MTPRCGYTLHNLYVYMCEECNLACKHCWQSASHARYPRATTVPVDVLCGFIDEAIPLGLRYVKISGGEPLLRKSELIAVLEHTRSRNLSTRVETNGTLIDDELAEAISRCRAAVSVSVDGGTAAVHETLRSVAGCFEATLDGLERLCRRKVQMELLLSLYTGNREDLPNVVSLARRFRCGGIKINPVLPTGRASKMERRGELLSIGELFEFVRQVERSYCGSVPPVRLSTEPAFHSLGAICAGQVAGGRCNFTHLLGVLADGRVSFCGMGYRAREYVFMQAGNGPLDEVWNEHPQLQQVRALIPDRLEGVCGNCVLKSSCQGGCRAEAYELYGSMTAPSPGCQRLYEAGMFPTKRLIAPGVDSRYQARPITTEGYGLPH